MRWQKLICLNCQLATNTLERVAPLTHAVGNVLKRVFVIGFSILAFGECLYSFDLIPFIAINPYVCGLNDTKILQFAGNKISTQTGIGTSIAIAGVAIYSLVKAKMEEEKRVSHFLL